MTTAASPMIEALFARRSANARMLASPGPDEAQLNQIVEAASRAPDHGRLVPFRFFAVADAARDRLADVLVRQPPRQRRAFHRRKSKGRGKRPIRAPA